MSMKRVTRSAVGKYLFIRSSRIQDCPLRTAISSQSFDPAGTNGPEARRLAHLLMPLFTHYWQMSTKLLAKIDIGSIGQ